MRPAMAILTLLALTGCGATTPAPEDPAAVEATIRALEQAEVDALLRSDLAAVRDHWADDYVVNNPFNMVVNASEGPIQAGTLTYDSFVREIERVVVHESTVIVMGNETVVPTATSPDGGRTIQRRFTNFWMNRDGRWLLSARHASIICDPEEG